MARVPQASPGVAAVDIRPVAPVYQQTSGLLVDAIQSRGAAQNIENAAQKVEGVGNVLANEAVKAQMEDNERSAKKADVALSEQMRAIMFGDGTPENPGFYGLKGEAALAAYPKVQAQMTEIRKKIGGDITNPKAREMFELSANSRFETEARAMGRFNQQERTVANDAISERRIREANDYAIAGWNNPEQVDKAHAILRGEVISRGQRNGEAPEVIASKLQEEQSKMYAGMINAALVYNPAEAQKLYDKYKPAIDGSVRPAIELKLEAGTSLQQVQIESDRILAMKGSPEQLIAEAEKIKDPKVRDGAVKAVEHKIAWRQARDSYAQTQAVKSARQDLFKAVHNNVTVEQWGRDNPSQYALLSGELSVIPNALATERMVAEGKLYANASDGKTLAELRKLPADKLAEVDPLVVQGRMTRQENQQFATIQAGAVNALRTAQQGSAKTNNDGAAALKDFAPKNSKGKIAVKDDVMNAATNEMNAWIESYTSKGKTPTPAEIRKKAAELTLEITAGKDWGDGAPSFTGIVGNASKMTPEQRAIARIPIEKVPADDLLKIKEALTQRGLPVTDDVIEQIAAADALNDQERMNRLLPPRK